MDDGTVSRNTSAERSFHKMPSGSIDQFLDAKIPRIDSIEGFGYSGAAAEHSPRNDLPIKINSNCLSH
jgi:hypothetical protein